MKKLTSLIAAGLLAMALLAGCGSTGGSTSASAAPQTTSLPEAAVSTSLPEQEPETGAARTEMHIAGLKGPTTMGLVKLMADADAGEARHDYEVAMYGTADEIVPQLVQGTLDIAMVPANLAAVLAQNDALDIQVAAINTLGVLYMLETGEEIGSVEDLRGKTIYSTGKGTTPEFALNYILTQNGLDPQNDVTIEFKSEATEVAAMLASEADAIAVLPQPYVTAAMKGNEALRVALNLTEEWDKVSADSSMVTGVLVARTAFIEENIEAFNEFLADYSASISWVNANVDEAGELVAEYGIVENPVIAAQALPNCNIVYIAGGEMKTALSGYLQVLYDADPASVGGALPEDGFYYGA